MAMWPSASCVTTLSLGVPTSKEGFVNGTSRLWEQKPDGGRLTSSVSYRSVLLLLSALILCLGLP